MDLRYFAYVSRGKVAQLYEQISELSDTTERLERRRELDGRVKAGGGLKGLLSADFEAGGIKSVVSEVTGTRGDIQKLQAVLEYIQAEEVVLDLNELCAQGPGAKLDGFAYAYRGSFTVLGSLAREPKGHNDGWDSPALTINEKVMLEGPDEIVLSRSSFVECSFRPSRL